MKNPRKLLLGFVKKYPALYEFLRYELYARVRSVNRKQLFLNAYNDNLWDHNFTVSGPGSSLEATEDLRKALPQLVATLGARSFLDIPCGDLQWMKHLSLGVGKYLGADIVFPLILKNREAFGDRGEFLHLDLLRDPLPSVDIIFCRDCLVHLSFRDIHRALDNICNAAPKYLLTTTFPDHKENMDTVVPYWRALNLQLSPFNFPEPIQLIKDFSALQRNDQGKYLGVWRMQELAPILFEKRANSSRYRNLR